MFLAASVYCVIGVSNHMYLERLLINKIYIKVFEFIYAENDEHHESVLVIKYKAERSFCSLLPTTLIHKFIEHLVCVMVAFEACAKHKFGELIIQHPKNIYI